MSSYTTVQVKPARCGCCQAQDVNPPPERQRWPPAGWLSKSPSRRLGRGYDAVSASAAVAVEGIGSWGSRLSIRPHTPLLCTLRANQQIKHLSAVYTSCTVYTGFAPFEIADPSRFLNQPANPLSNQPRHPRASYICLYTPTTDHTTTPTHPHASCFHATAPAF